MKYLWLLSLLCVIGCQQPTPPPNIVDGVLTIQHRLAADDQVRAVGMNIAEEVAQGATPEVKEVHIQLMWPAGFNSYKHCGNVLVGAEETNKLASYDTSKYRWDYQNDYAVAVYDACTPIALATSQTDTQALIKYRRSPQYKKGILGESMPEFVTERTKQ